MSDTPGTCISPHTQCHTIDTNPNPTVSPSNRPAASVAHWMIASASLEACQLHVVTMTTTMTSSQLSQLYTNQTAHTVQLLNQMLDQLLSKTIKPMTADQKWQLGLETLISSFEVSSNQHALARCILKTRCGVPPDIEGLTGDCPSGSIWSQLWIIILLIIAFIVACLKRRRDAKRDGLPQRGGLPQRSDKVVQNAAYAVTPVTGEISPTRPTHETMPILSAATNSFGPAVAVDNSEC